MGKPSRAGRLGLSHWAGPSVTRSARWSQRWYRGIIVDILAKCQSTTLRIRLRTFPTHLRCISEALLCTLTHCISDSACYATLHHPLHLHLHMCHLCLFVCLFVYLCHWCMCCLFCLFVSPSRLVPLIDGQ